VFAARATQPLGQLGEPLRVPADQVCVPPQLPPGFVELDGRRAEQGQGRLEPRVEGGRVGQRPNRLPDPLRGCAVLAVDQPLRLVGGRPEPLGALQHPALAVQGGVLTRARVDRTQFLELEGQVVGPPAPLGAVALGSSRSGQGGQRAVKMRRPPAAARPAPPWSCFVGRVHPQGVEQGEVGPPSAARRAARGVHAAQRPPAPRRHQHAVHGPAPATRTPLSGAPGGSALPRRPTWPCPSWAAPACRPGSAAGASSAASSGPPTRTGQAPRPTPAARRPGGRPAVRRAPPPPPPRHRRGARRRSCGRPAPGGGRSPGSTCPRRSRR
jgi:hypothetical protein